MIWSVFLKKQKSRQEQLADEIIQTLKDKGFSQPFPTEGPRYSGAIADIAAKICAGASITRLAEFTDKIKRKSGVHFIFGDRTLLHLFCGRLFYTQAYCNTVHAAYRILTTPNQATGAMDFDLEHHDNLRGYTPLHWAAATGGPKMCKMLLEAGANPRAQSTGGVYAGAPVTPLDLALEAGQLDSAHVLRTWFAKAAVEEMLKGRDTIPRLLAAGETLS